MALIVPLFAFLFLFFVTETQEQFCEEKLNKFQLKPFPINNLTLVEGSWFLLGFLDSENEIYNKSQNIQFDYKPDRSGNYINVTKFEKPCNQDEVLFEEKIVFINSNEIEIYLNNNNPNATVYNFHIINWDITNSNYNNQFLIYYSCTEKLDGSKRTLFALLTREFAQGPNSYVLKYEIESLLKIKDNDNLKGNLKVFGKTGVCQEGEVGSNGTSECCW